MGEAFLYLEAVAASHSARPRDWKQWITSFYYQSWTSPTCFTACVFAICSAGFTHVLVPSLNPWQDHKLLYGKEVINSYRNKPLDDTLPDVFAVSEAAFTNLRTERKDQTILVSGDSGSGKTESTKFMMQYLAAVAHHTAMTANIEQQVPPIPSPSSFSPTSCLHVERIFHHPFLAPAFSLLFCVRVLECCFTGGIPVLKASCMCVHVCE